MDPSAKPEAPPWWGFTQALLVGSCLLIVGLALLRGDQELKSSDWPSYMVAGRLAAAQPDRLYVREHCSPAWPDWLAAPGRPV